jgi:SNF2 family DNA or RNA helicase
VGLSMSIKSHAQVNRGASDKTVVLTPGEGTSLRSLESLLLRHGISAFIARQARQAHLPTAAFVKLRKENRDWSFEVEASMEGELGVIENLSSRHDRAWRALQSVNMAEIGDLLPDFPERDKLDAHQIQAVAALSHPDIHGLCLFDEQGLGKTIMALFAFHKLRTEDAVTKMLVVCPKNVAFEWAHDVERFFGPKYQVSMAIGTEREKRQQFSRKSDIYVTNFESVSSLNIRLRQLLEAERGRALLVIDESFFVKNAAARRTQAVRKLREAAGRCFVLCGTPAPNAANDLVEQFNIADGGSSFQDIDVPDDRDAAAPIVSKVVSERGLYLRRLKDQVLDLPGRTFHQVLVPMQPDQDKAYRTVLGGLIGALHEVDDVLFKKNLASFAARRMALLQICSHPASIVEGYREVPAKVLALDSLLEELISKRGEKVVLWSYFTASLDAMSKRFTRFNPVRLDGSVTEITDRRSAIRRFQEDATTMLFIANPAAAGAGITLHRARYCIYESMSNQAAHYLQSLDRVHRRGQSRPVEYFILLAEKSIEIREFQRLREKEQSAQALLGDRVHAPVTRLSMLKEALDAAQVIGMDIGSRVSG